MFIQNSKIYKAKKFACRSLKGKGVQSGVRVIYVYFEEVDNIEHIKKKYLKNDFSWSGKSMCAMAEEVGFLEEYKVMYFQLSEIEHTG